MKRTIIISIITTIVTHTLLTTFVFPKHKAPNKVTIDWVNSSWTAFDPNLAPTFKPTK